MSLRRKASKYGVSSSHADEDTLPTETQTSFFQKGREFESRYVNHHYTAEEREKLGTFESVDYLPPHSAVYKVSLCRICVLELQCVRLIRGLMQSIPTVPIPPPPRADPRELGFFESKLANAPPPGQKSCSNTPG